MRPTPVIALIGPAGAGKSSAGARAAALLGLPFVDVDQRLEQREAASIAEIWQRGEAYFRARELEALAACLQERGLVAAGGGATVTRRGQSLLAAVPCVLLRVRTDIAVRRLGTDRPWLPATSPLAAYRARERARRAARDALADRVVDANRPLLEVVAALTKVVSELLAEV
jgi:shikimate kinase